MSCPKQKHHLFQILPESLKLETSVSPVPPLSNSPSTNYPKLSLNLALSLHPLGGCLGHRCLRASGTPRGFAPA